MHVHICGILRVAKCIQVRLKQHWKHTWVIWLWTECFQAAQHTICIYAASKLSWC